MSTKNDDLWTGFGLLALVAFLLTNFAAFVEHIWWTISLCMSTTEIITGGRAALMILGVLFPPLGCLHGWYLWFH